MTQDEMNEMKTRLDKASAIQKKLTSITQILEQIEADCDWTKLTCLSGSNLQWRYSYDSDAFNRLMLTAIECGLKAETSTLEKALFEL